MGSWLGWDSFFFNNTQNNFASFHGWHLQLDKMWCWFLFFSFSWWPWRVWNPGFLRRVSVRENKGDKALGKHVIVLGWFWAATRGAWLREEEHEGSRSVEPCFLLGSGGRSQWYIGLDFQSPLSSVWDPGSWGGPSARTRTCRGLRSAAFLPAALPAACGSRWKWALSGPVCSWPASGEEWTAPGTSWWWGCLLIPLHT